jgi:mannose-1-phosphate guanylyltransferase/mannose-1-phosphate guanylyltransferase/mannose-6-phosphate isomerase
MINLILSGGSGTRLWPASREKWPKQFSQLFKPSLAERTLERCKPLGPSWLVGSSQHKVFLQKLKEKFPDAIEDQILEPFPRNTAAAVALACFTLHKKSYQNEVVGVFPSDHLIQDESTFLVKMKSAEKIAQEGQVVVFGIQPDFPSTEFGYIEIQKESAKNRDPNADSAFPVASFHEKPNLERAKSYVESGRSFWNAGMYVFKVGTMIQHFKKHLPALWSEISKLKDDRSNLPELFESLESISLDHGIAEKLQSDEILCLPVKMGWSDVGTWDAFFENDVNSKHRSQLIEKRENGATDSNSNALFTMNPKKTYALAEVQDLYVVDTEDALFICPKGKSHLAKNLVEDLKKDRAVVAEEHPFEERPWGRYEILKDGDSFKSKIIEVNPGQRISYQSHKKREEYWTIIDGGGVVILDDKEIPVRKGSTVHIPQRAKHRIHNTGTKPLRFLELQLGESFEESDIIRYSDDYSREG